MPSSLYLVNSPTAPLHHAHTTYRRGHSLYCTCCTIRPASRPSKRVVRDGLRARAGPRGSDRPGALHVCYMSGGPSSWAPYAESTLIPCATALPRPSSRRMPRRPRLLLQVSSRLSCYRPQADHLPASAASPTTSRAPQISRAPFSAPSAARAFVPSMSEQDYLSRDNWID